MSITQERAREIYQAYLEDHFDDDGLEELAESLEVELTDEDPDQAASIIVEHLATAEALEQFLKSQSENAWILLLRLLELGDVHPPGSYMSGMTEMAEEDLTPAFLVLRSAGLITATLHGDMPCLAIQPYAKFLLQEPIDQLRRSRYEEDSPSSDAVIPLGTILSLGVNHTRSHAVRVTKNGDIHQRDKVKGNSLFKNLTLNGKELPFEYLLQSLVKLNILGISSDNHLCTNSTFEFQKLKNNPADLALQLLLSSTSKSPISLALLYLAQAWKNDLPGGWIEDRRLLRTAELFSMDEGPQVKDEDSSDRATQFTFARTCELVWLGLLEYSKRGETLWFKLSDIGETALSKIIESKKKRKKDDEEEAPPQPLAQAIIQPNLEILVPLTAPAETHLEIGSLGRLEVVDELCRYVIEKEHVKRVFTRELISKDDWKERIKACSSYEIPDNVLRTIDGWIQNITVLNCERGSVISLPEDQNGDAQIEALKNAAEKVGAKSLGEGLYLIPENVTLEKVSRILNEEGLKLDSKELDEDLEFATESHDFDAKLRRLSRNLQDIQLYCHNFLDSTPVFDQRERITKAESTLDSQPDRNIEHQWVSDNSGEIPAFLHQAVRQNWKIDIHLDSSYINPERSLIPDTVLRRGAKVYLTGTCLDTQENRAFPIESIEKARRSVS